MTEEAKKEEKKDSGLMGLIKSFFSKKISIPITLSLTFGAGAATHNALAEPEVVKEEVVKEVVVEPEKPEISTGQTVTLGDGGSIPGLSIVYEFEYKGKPYRCFRWRAPDGFNGSLSCSPL